jgi:hypothetical protein
MPFEPLEEAGVEGVIVGLGACVGLSLGHFGHTLNSTVRPSMRKNKLKHNEVAQSTVAPQPAL